MRDERRDQQYAYPATQMTDAIDKRKARRPRSGRKVLGRPAIGNRDPEVESEEDEKKADTDDADKQSRKGPHRDAIQPRGQNAGRLTIRLHLERLLHLSNNRAVDFIALVQCKLWFNS